MRRSTLLMPISMLLAACTLIVLLFLQPSAGSRAAQLGDISDYPFPTQTAIANATATALALVPGDGYTAPSDETAGAATAAPTVQSALTPTGTATGARMPTATPDPNDFGAVTATTQSSTSTDAEITATTQGTPTPTPDANTRACVPGETVAISGQGPANAGFLVYFADRVVSGGTVRRDGRFDVGLVVGNEREGNYPVEIRIRGTRTALAKFTCQVPAATTPRAVSR